MEHSKAVIRKVDNEYCVFSESGKNLGCAPSRDGAKKRLKQVEFFKHKGKATMTGTVAGHPSKEVVDGKDHFPIETEGQARDAVLRATALQVCPVWFDGPLDRLRNTVCINAGLRYPTLSVRKQISVAAISKAFAESITKDGVIVKNPNMNPPHVPEVITPTLTNTGPKNMKDLYANTKAGRKSLAGDLMKVIDQREEALKKAKKIASRLTKDGVTADEFNSFMTFIQEDILREIIFNTQVNANRAGALDLMVKRRASENFFRGPQKPTDGGDKKKKKKKKTYSDLSDEERQAQTRLFHETLKKKLGQA